MICSAATPVKAMPFFLPGSRGDLFAIYYPPSGAQVRGGLLYVHAFAEEANCSRPVIATVARAIAQLGYGVLAVDLYGCGDSTGEFRDALWANWLEDLAFGVQWLQGRGFPQVSLWGLRFGGLLALDFAKQYQRTFPFIILWHPPTNGAETLKQFLRLSLVREADGPVSPLTTKGLRRRLAAGRCVEIAGWELSPDIAFALERLETSSLLSEVSSAIYCVEFVQATKLVVVPSRLRLVQVCNDNGVAINFRQLQVRTFWADRAEMTDCQILIDFMHSVLMSSANESH